MVSLSRKENLVNHTTTLEDASHTFDDTISTLRKHFTHIDRLEPEYIKLANEYYKWIILKTNLISNEKSFQIPPTAFPNIVNSVSFNWLRPEKQTIVSKYYRIGLRMNKCFQLSLIFFPSLMDSLL